MNFTDTQMQDIVDQLNKDELIRLIPMFIFLSLITVIGIPGNGLVCYIYWSKYSMSSSRWFIFFLAVWDMLICGITVPSEITASLYQYNFTNTVVCKLATFLNLWVLLTLGFIVVVISVQRYRKVCTHQRSWQIDVKKAKILSTATVVVGFLLSIPIWWIYGIHKYELTKHGVNASECSFKESSTKSYFAFYYLMFAMVVFICSLCTISILFCFIGKNIKELLRKEKMRRRVHVTAAFESSHVPVAVKNDNASSIFENDGEKVQVKSEPKLTSHSDTSSFENVTEEQISTTACDTNIFSPEMPGPRTKRQALKRTKQTRSEYARKATKATISMFLVSLAFILSYLPLLVLVLTRSVVAGFEAGLTDAGRATYKFFLRLCFLSGAINPFIYGLSDSEFREHCKAVFCKLFTNFKCISCFKKQT